MGSATYTPPPGEPQTTQFRGVQFEAGKSVEIKDPMALRKLDGSGHFEVQMSDEERKAAQEAGPNPLAGAVFTGAIPSHQPYYGSGPVTDDPEARAESSVPPTPPTSANAAGGGLNTATLGDAYTPEQVFEKYGTDNPTDSQEPGEAYGVTKAKPEIEQVISERQAQAQQAQAQAAPRRGPGRPPNRRPESE